MQRTEYTKQAYYFFIVIVAVICTILMIGLDRYDSVSKTHRICDIAAVDESYQPQCAEALKKL